MESYGTGGRAGDGFTVHVLDGVLSEDVHIEPLPTANCANPKCLKLFRPRADGDSYCSQACEFDSNPQYKGRTDK